MIDEQSIQVLGHGSASIDDSGLNVIRYHSGTEQSSQGLSRVIFSYINSEEQLVIQGLIDVAVGTTVGNYAPKAMNFRYGDLETFRPGKQLDYQYVKVGEEITIDIAPYFSEGLLDAYNLPIALTDDNGEPIFDEQGKQIHYYLESDQVTSTPIYKAGNFLIDRDKDLVQLTNVYAYDAYVRINADENFTNTSFTFKGDKSGTYYVTYVLSDHNGGYGTGIIEIKVGPPNSARPWDTFLYFDTDTSKRFRSPLTKDIADYLSLTYTTVTEEDGTNGPAGLGTPLFDYNTADSFCSQLDLRLPTLDELTSLKDKYPQGLYRSLDINNPEESKRNNQVNWPTSASFWALIEQPGSISASAVKLDSTFSQETVSITNDEQRAAVCITPYSLTDILVGPDNVELGVLEGSHQLTAMASYGDVGIHYSRDITRFVTWETSDPQITTVTAKGMLISGSELGSAYVTASKGDITSNIVNVNTICTNKTLALACIDIVNSGNGKLFTSSPSVSYLDSIGGSSLAGGIYTERKTFGPVGDFYIIRWDNAQICAVPTIPSVSAGELIGVYRQKMS